MAQFTGAWSATEAESYLRESRVPLRLACHRPDESLWMVALWYRYRDGAFERATWAEADVVGYLRNDSQVAFEVSENRPPYRGNGSATLSPDADKAVLRDLVERYLGDADSELAQWLLSEEREEVRIRAQPDRIYSWDYSDRMAAGDGE